VAGDQAAFDPIVRAYMSRAYHYAYSIVSNHHDAMDVAQESFVRAFRALDRFDLARPFLPWLLRIVRNASLDVCDKRRRQPERPGSEDPADTMRLIPSTAKGPDAPVIRKEEAARIQAAIDKLTPDQREIIHLRHFGDMSYETMAEVLDIPLGTVMSRLYHARKKLGKILKPA
jgi:RNA polymerase sigma-70 factor (ECF subfamily)